MSAGSRPPHLSLSWIPLLALFITSTACSGEVGVEYRNGLWFDGNAFEDRTWYVVGGELREARPAQIDSVVDLGGGYVVPPFGEAHNHIAEVDHVEQYARMFMNDGVFYIKDQGNALFSRPAVAARMNQQDSPDFISANQGFTGPGGHPLQVVGQLQQVGAYPADRSVEEIDGDAVMIVASLDDLEEKWEAFLAASPDFVKVFLLYSEVHQARAHDPAFAFQRGIDPELVPEIVDRAHRVGLEVSAHVYSANDFRVAVEAGVDQLSHLPGVGYDASLGADAFLLVDADVQSAADAGVTVVTTMAQSWASQPADGPARTVMLSNLRKLRDGGVQLLIGSDRFRGTSKLEAEFLSTLGEFSNLELLRIWAVDTPQMIFPHRDIGAFEEGFEASFLVLARNPLEDFARIREITRRVKLGRLVPERLVEFPGFPGR